MSPIEIICMKCQILFSVGWGGGGGDKKNIINSSSAELALRVVMVNSTKVGTHSSVFGLAQIGLHKTA